MSFHAFLSTAVSWVNFTRLVGEENWGQGEVHWQGELSVCVCVQEFGLYVMCMSEDGRQPVTPKHEIMRQFRCTVGGLACGHGRFNSTCYTYLQKRTNMSPQKSYCCVAMSIDLSETREQSSPYWQSNRSGLTNRCHSCHLAWGLNMHAVELYVPMINGYQN